jgi:hypothetical protein
MSTTGGENDMVQGGGVFTVVCHDVDGNLKWEETFQNLVVTQGKNYLLDKIFAGSAYTAAWYMGLIDSASPTYSATDTITSHSGFTEVAASTGYTYSASATNRATVAWNAASAGSKGSTTTVFNITSTLATVSGVLLTNVQARNTASNGDSAATGFLYSAGSFGSSKAVASGDTLNVTYTASV